MIAVRRECFADKNSCEHEPTDKVDKALLTQVLVRARVDDAAYLARLWFAVRRKEQLEKDAWAELAFMRERHRGA